MRELHVHTTFSAVALEEPLSWWVRQLWPGCRLVIGGHDTLFQCVFDPDAHGLRDADGTLLLALDPQTLERLDSDALTRLDFQQALARLAERPGLRVVLALLHGQGEGNDDTIRALSDVRGVVTVGVSDIERFLTAPVRAPRSTAQVAGIPYTRRYLAALATAVAWRLDRLERPLKKVLALDCDHTLWSGVVGEDGVAGLRIDQRHRRLGHLARRLRSEGWLICLCSKNEAADVRAAINALGHDLGVRWNDLAATRVNWDDKPSNLRSLAEELGFGLDSFVFVDDNPVECATVRAALPEVSVLHVDPGADNDWLERVWLFDQRETTREDAQRAQFYERNREREALRQETGSAREFLAALAIELSVAPAKAEEARRIAQLSVRTNQFNFSGLKLEEPEVADRITGEDAVVIRAMLSDRFGDYGLVGATIARRCDDRLVVDGFWLSCRALGRGVEHAMVCALGEAAAQHGCPALLFELNELPRNIPARRFADALPAARAGDDGITVPVSATRDFAFDPDRTTAEAPPATMPKPVSEAPRAIRDDGLLARCAMDAALLQEIEGEAAPRPDLQQPYVAPRSALERTLAQIWSQTLALDAVGICDEFEALGGRSIQLVTIHARIRERLGSVLEFVDLFRFTSIAALARHLEGGASGRVMDDVVVRAERQRRAAARFRRINRSDFRVRA